MKNFVIGREDGSLTTLLKREANVKLASLSNDEERTKTFYDCQNAIRIAKAIDSIEPQNQEEVDSVLNIINTIWDKGILSPLTLNNDEFSEFNVNGIANNLRYHNIYKSDTVDENGKYIIYNRSAYKAIVRKQYDFNYNSQTQITQKEFNLCPTIFINKGGKITGEHIDICRIRPEVVDKHCYTIQSTVSIPVSAIYGKGIGIILTVDHRESKLKVLKEFYDVPISYSEEINKLNIDIRKFKKF
jgi:hypothetical protein